MAKQEKNSREQENEALRLLSAIVHNVNKHLAPDPQEGPEAAILDILERYPLLHTAMYAHYHEGGHQEGATLIMWGSDQGATVLCNLKFLGVKAFFNAPRLSEALEAIEKALADPDFKWQSDKPKKGHRKPQKGYRKH